MNSVRKINAKKIMALTIAFLSVMIIVETVMPSCFAEPAFAAKAKKPARVKITSVKRSGLKITVKWKQAKNAKKYQVYQKIGSGKWKLRKTVKKLKLTITGAYGKTYSFRVRGVNGKKKGRFSAVKTLRVPKKSASKPSTPDPKPEPQPEPVQEQAVKITEQPQDVTVKDGEEAAFKVSCELTDKAAAEGVTLSYQWYRNRAGGNASGTKISGAEGPEYVIKADMFYSGSYYFCIITAGNEKIKTDAAKFTVTYGDKVYILSSNGDVDVVEGVPVTFSVEAVGAGELTYQWYKSDSQSTSSGEPIKGETGPVLSMTALNTDSGKYFYCKVQDAETEGFSTPAKLTASVSEEHRKAVADIKALIAEHGVLTTATVLIDGLDFYVIANENGKALLLAKQPSSYYEHSISDNDKWDCNFEGRDPEGENPYFDENYDPIEETNDHYGAVVELNKDYLAKNPTIDCIAVPTLHYTLHGGNYTMDVSDYYILTKKIFILTQGDVTGMYAGENSGPYDYTFNMSQFWTHFGVPLPQEIVNMYVDGELVPWFVRSPYLDWGEESTPAVVAADPDSSKVEAIGEDESVKAYARPAFWVDIEKSLN